MNIFINQSTKTLSFSILVHQVQFSSPPSSILKSTWFSILLNQVQHSSPPSPARSVFCPPSSVFLFAKFNILVHQVLIEINITTSSCVRSYQPICSHLSRLQNCSSDFFFKKKYLLHGQKSPWEHTEILQLYPKVVLMFR